VTEEAVGVRGTTLRPGFANRSINAQAFLLCDKIPVILNYKIVHRWGIPAQRLVVAERQRLDRPPDGNPDQLPPSA